jgi:hypothetical protein
LLSQLIESDVEITRIKEENKTLKGRVEELEDSVDAELQGIQQEREELEQKVQEDRDQLAEEKERIAEAPIFKILGQVAQGQMVSVSRADLAGLVLTTSDKPQTKRKSAKTVTIETAVSDFDPDDTDKSSDDIPF